MNLRQRFDALLTAAFFRWSEPIFMTALVAYTEDVERARATVNPDLFVHLVTFEAMRQRLQDAQGALHPSGRALTRPWRPPGPGTTLASSPRCLTYSIKRRSEWTDRSSKSAIAAAWPPRGKCSSPRGRPTMHSPTEMIRTFPPPAPTDLLSLLTPRERDIVLLIAYRAFTNHQISQELGTSEQTVKNQITVIFRKVGALSRAQLALYVIRGGAL